MAFETAAARAQAVQQAGNVVGMIRTVYFQAAQLKATKALYTAGTNPTFNAAFDALFNGAELAELAAMITQLETLLTDWEANHAWVTTP